ncbi:glycoside hydrolase family 95 protein, partial [Streptomyces sp. TRM76130]|nr:glycoside hydrolase family 95 protein [Streptomyces sp. TRM76130]
AGDVTAAEEFTDGRPLQWVQPFHPAFQLRLRRPPGPGHAHRRTVDFATGETTATAGGWTSRVFVSRADDVIVQQVTAPHLTLDLALDHRLPGAPAGLAVGHGAVRTPEGAVLSLRARYPGSDRAYTGVTVAAVSGGATALVPPGLLVERAASLLLLTRVRRHTGELDVHAESRALGDLMTGRTYEDLLDRHLLHHRTAYDRVTLDLAADPADRALPGSELLGRPGSPALLERLFAAGRYHLLSASGL